MELVNKRFTREAFFEPSTVDDELRTVTVCWTTGQRVDRRGFSEELAVEPNCVRLNRLNAGAPLLNAHQNDDLRNQIGVVERAWLDGNKGFASIRFSKRADVEPIFQDVKDGILRNISVGYIVHKAEEKDKSQRLFRATDWEPLELSIVSVPADSGASIRANKGEAMEEIEQTREQEVMRIRQITDLGSRFNLPQVRVQEMVASGSTVDGARAEILEFLAKRSDENRISPRIESIRDERETRREGMVNAILNRHDAGAVLNENGRRFRQLSLVDMAREIVGDRHAGREDVVTRAFHSTSDFPEILGSVAKQRLLISYENLAKKQNFWPMAKVRSVPDFKPVRTVRMGEMPSLAPLPEGAEYSFGTLGETAEQYAITTYGKALGISRQMVINDDLGALDTLGNWGAAISRLESALFWNIFNANPALSNGKKLFGKEHGNRSEVGQELTIESLSMARIAMSRQQGLDKRDGEYLDLHPEFLIVPIELQTQAEQFLAREVVPQSPDKVNPFKGAFQLITTTWIKDPKAWFLTCGQSQGVDLIEMAYLDGVRQPYVEWKSDFDTDSLKVKVRYDVGSKAIDYRGFYQGGFSK